MTSIVTRGIRSETIWLNAARTSLPVAAVEHSFGPLKHCTVVMHFKSLLQVGMTRQMGGPVLMRAMD